MDRRSLIKAAAALGAGLLLPSTVQENAEAARRWWQLDKTMVPAQEGGMAWWLSQAKGPTGDMLSSHDLERILREKWVSHRTFPSPHRGVTLTFDRDGDGRVTLNVVAEHPRSYEEPYSIAL